MTNSPGLDCMKRVAGDNLEVFMPCAVEAPCRGGELFCRSQPLPGEGMHSSQRIVSDPCVRVGTGKVSQADRFGEVGSRFVRQSTPLLLGSP